MLVREIFRPQGMSRGVVRNREALDILMPLPKRKKIYRTSLYQISKFSLSLDVGDITGELKERWSRPVRAPSVESLRLHLQQALQPEEKIPISQKKFDLLCVPFSAVAPKTEITSQALSTLFRVSADESAPFFEQLFSYAIDSVPPTTGTEVLFHLTYDLNIRLIVNGILSAATSIRNTDRQTSTALKIPDYGLLINSHCILRGEEMGSNADGDPRQELVKKLTRWEYDPLNYILGLL
jgi:hypothetical protein